VERYPRVALHISFQITAFQITAFQITAF